MKITVVGLGVRSGDVSVRGAKAIEEADCVVLKTALTEASGYVSEHVHGFVALDGVYESAGDFDKLNRHLAREVIKLAKDHENTVYCVPGSGQADVSVRLLAERVKRLEYCLAASSAEHVLAGTAPSCSYTAYSAYDLPEAVLMKADKRFPFVVYDMDNQMLASGVKLCLTRYFGDEAPAWFVSKSDAKRIALFEADMQERYDYSCALAVCPAPLLERKAFDYYDLVEIMGRLRADDGCPWDRAQTHESIKSNLVEEAYELVEAIELSAPDKMCEETGDVLLQTVFHAYMGEEAGEFTFQDMFDELCGKLIFRHSHIFGSDKAENDGEALDTWEKNKRVEKNQETLYDALASVPRQFPALLRAYKVLKKAIKAGLAPALDPASPDPYERLLALVAEFASRGEEPELGLKQRTDALVAGFKGKA